MELLQLQLNSKWSRTNIYCCCSWKNEEGKTM